MMILVVLLFRMFDASLPVDAADGSSTGRLLYKDDEPTAVVESGMDAVEVEVRN
jgi:hypothetical protein